MTQRWVEKLLAEEAKAAKPQRSVWGFPVKRVEENQPISSSSTLNAWKCSARFEQSIMLDFLKEIINNLICAR